MSLKCFNKVILKGFLGKAPEVRLLPSGDSVTNFSIATTIHDHTEWHKIVCFNKTAEYAIKNFAEGDFVYIEAQIRTREFKTAEAEEKGHKPKKVLELIAHEVHLVSKRGVGHGTVDNEKKDGLNPEKSEENESDVDNVYNTGAGEAKPLPKFI